MGKFQQPKRKKGFSNHIFFKNENQKNKNQLKKKKNQKIKIKKQKIKRIKKDSEI